MAVRRQPDLSGAAGVMPLSAVVGQAPIKRALMALAVDAAMGGLLIRGEKGTGKSTLARGLARLLPSRSVNRGCPFGCPSDGPRERWCARCQGQEQQPEREQRPAGFITLPLGATEDQLLGTLDLQAALGDGQRRFEPGLLARANGGVLYVDEVNLLDDQVVDLLLDVAASGVNVVAREGITASHPAELLLVGTMNPEEGELRPQLQDRFGLCAPISRLDDPAQRAEIVARCLAFEADPAGFAAAWAEQEQALAEEVLRGQALLPTVEVERSWLEAAARLAIELEVDGHRGEILLIRCARALAALDGRSALVATDLEQAAGYVFSHRLRRRPFEEASLTPDELARRAREALARPKGSSAEKKSPPSG